MLTLSDLQGLFLESLLSAPGTQADPLLLETVRTQGAPPAKRLAVYKNNIHSQLARVLADSYPAIQRLTGAAFFRFAATEYILAHPPRSPELLDFGKKFPCFLETFAPARSLPYLPDVARLEQLYLESYHAAEGTPLLKEAFGHCLSNGASASIVRLHPSARLMSSPHPVSQIWEVNVRATDAEAKGRVSGGAEYLLVIRPHATVEVRRIPRGAFAALHAIARGASIAEALAAGSQAEPRLDLVMHLLSLAAGQSFVWEK
ncbi:MAG: DNA-binding domain-containing protein [Woeseia sp.]